MSIRFIQQMTSHVFRLVFVIYTQTWIHEVHPHLKQGDVNTHSTLPVSEEQQDWCTNTVWNQVKRRRGRQKEFGKWCETLIGKTEGKKKIWGWGEDPSVNRTSVIIGSWTVHHRRVTHNQPAHSPNYLTM